MVVARHNTVLVAAQRKHIAWMVFLSVGLTDRSIRKRAREKREMNEVNGTPKSSLSSDTAAAREKNMSPTVNISPPPPSVRMITRRCTFFAASCANINRPLTCAELSSVYCATTHPSRSRRVISSTAASP
eukprot:7389826-Prymnesium_polylepis.1